MSERPTSGPAPRWGEYAPVPEVPAESATTEPAKSPVVADDEIRDQPAERPVRRWDVALTIGLLVFGAFNVLTSIPGMLNLGMTLDELYRAAGYGSYTSDSLASGVGIAINIVHVVLLIAAVALSSAGLKARRVTFWIPLTAGVLAGIIVTALFAVAMLSDPALPAYLDEQMRSVATTAP